MHYLKNQTATLGFSYQKEHFFIPVIMILTVSYICMFILHKLKIPSFTVDNMVQ